MAGRAVRPGVLVELGVVEGGLVVLDFSVVTCPPATPPVGTVLGLSLATVMWKSGGRPISRGRK